MCIWSERRWKSAIDQWSEHCKSRAYQLDLLIKFLVTFYAMMTWINTMSANTKGIKFCWLCTGIGANPLLLISELIHLVYCWPKTSTFSTQCNTLICKVLCSSHTLYTAKCGMHVCHDTRSSVGWTKASLDMVGVIFHHQRFGRVSCVEIHG